jgi:hypothetical protein
VVSQKIQKSLEAGFVALGRLVVGEEMLLSCLLLLAGGQPGLGAGVGKPHKAQKQVKKFSLGEMILGKPKIAKNGPAGTMHR